MLLTEVRLSGFFDEESDVSLYNQKTRVLAKEAIQRVGIVSIPGGPSPKEGLRMTVLFRNGEVQMSFR